MRVCEIMHPIISCEADLEVHKVTEKIIKSNRGSIIITENEKPIGIFTERDALKLIARGEIILGLKISEVMTPLKYTVGMNTSISEASELMNKNDIRRLPVIDGAGDIKGIVTASSIGKSMKYMMARSLMSGKGISITV